MRSHEPNHRETARAASVAARPQTLSAGPTSPLALVLLPRFLSFPSPPGCLFPFFFWVRDFLFYLIYLLSSLPSVSYLRSFFWSVISFFILIFFFLRCLPFLPPPPRYFLFFSTIFPFRVPPPPHHSLPLPFSASEFLTFLTHLSKIQFKMTVASKVFGFSKKGTYHKTPFAQRHFPNKNIIPSSQSLH